MRISLALLLALFFGASASLAQTLIPGSSEVIPAVSTSSSDRLFLPKNFIRGYTEFGAFPSHNEMDMGRCLSTTGNFGGSNAPCAAFGRFFLGGYMELRPFSRKIGPIPVQRLFLFVEPHGYFGKNVPQFLYTNSLDPIGIERSLGAGVELPHNLEVRVWQHQTDWLGRYRHGLGVADMGKGPYGMYSGVSARWYFGGYGRTR